MGQVQLLPSQWEEERCKGNQETAPVARGPEEDGHPEKKGTSCTYTQMAERVTLIPFQYIQLQMWEEARKVPEYVVLRSTYAAGVHTTVTFWPADMHTRYDTIPQQ